MNVLVLTYGSRGDVQPFLALACALQQAGHRAVLAAPARFASFSAEYGVPFAPLSEAMVDVADTAELRAVREGGTSQVQGLGLWLEALRQGKDAVREVLADTWTAASSGFDLVVHHPITAGQHVAEKLGVPAVMAAPQPAYVPTDAFPCPLMPTPPWLPPVFNRLTYRLLGLSGSALHGPIDQWRTESLGLPKRRGRHNPLRRPDGTPAPVLLGYSPHVFPQPRDWSTSVRTTGYWFLPAATDWTPPAELVRFLDSGQPPVCLSFGSLVGADPARTGRLVVEAVQRAGARAVLVAGWGGLQASDLPEDVTLVEQAPFDWLLPQTGALVHHGGAGTTGAAVVSGRPQVVCPFTNEPMWSHRMFQLGVAPAPIPQSELSVEGLAAAIRHVRHDELMASRAKELGRVVGDERGAATAVTELERIYTSA